MSGGMSDPDQQMQAQLNREDQRLLFCKTDGCAPLTETSLKLISSFAFRVWRRPYCGGWFPQEATAKAMYSSNSPFSQPCQALAMVSGW
jgi:hypothetical protein